MIVLAVYGARVNGRWRPELEGDMSDTEPKPVKPLVAFAAVREGAIAAGSVSTTESGARSSIGLIHAGGWIGAVENGYRIIKVRIEPVEE